MSLAHAVFTDRQVRLFRWLFAQPDRSFYMNELMRLTGLSSASLQQELKRLSLAGLVQDKRVGNLRVFRANPASPLFPELVSLTRKTCGVASVLAQSLESLRPKLVRALIYGSVARQEDNATSDVDLMLVGVDLTLAEVLQQLQPAEEALGRKVNPTCYTLQEFEQRRADPGSFVNQVLAQPTINLLEGTHGEH
jgi:predicted nucleotidyltransferase